MLKRKIYEQLIEWKNKSNGKTALLIDGARRVGKSFMAELFARQEYGTCRCIWRCVCRHVTEQKFPRSGLYLDAETLFCL